MSGSTEAVMTQGLTCDGCSTTLELSVTGSYVDTETCDERDLKRSLPRTIRSLAMWIGWECVTTRERATDLCPACRRK